MSQPIIETHALVRRFGSMTAVGGLTLSIEAGEVFGLLGRNGAGKTTLIKMLTTLLPPSGGTASVGGFDIVREAASVRRIIGYVPQALSADGDLSGFENLLVFAKLYDIPRAQREKRIQDALAFMDLADVGHKLVKTYSGGMIRRLEIAQSTLHRPRVLFLDEPTVGLDPVARISVWEQLEKLQAEFGSAILLTTHYLEEAERLCDRVGIMNHGTIAAIGSPAELKAVVGAHASFEDVFEHYTSADAAQQGAYDETSQTRRSANRLA
ncbi:ATP-binding cassette domain-containing protein [Cupriavidus basilensis]|uniref:ATP-binding cassette domain-containing protein n=1 Tax=Cupriavidus basilensis TaxID=68895 RepID=UPI0007507777|nr:ATP-binding cassette domain-containing protein [Cupriavidus basilensis]